jgi:hypothetical protein
MRLAGVGLLLVSGVALASQPPASPVPPATVVSFVVAGRVADATTGDAIRHAQVAVSSAAAFTETTLTDTQGRFTSTGVPAGHFTVTVSKPGFVRRTVGAETRAAFTSTSSSHGAQSSLERSATTVASPPLTRAWSSPV